MLALVLLACTPPSGSTVWPGGIDTGVGTSVEQVSAGPVCDPDDVYSDTVVHAVEITLSAEAIASLEMVPDGYVQGRVWFDGVDQGTVGVRLKGSSSWQWIDRKPAWKIKFDLVRARGRLCGLKRLTLDNNVWDTSMMAETLAYRAFRAAGSPAPRTGYATATLNGEDLGLYTIVESMDDVFVEQNWPGSEGGLWEMTRDCDFVGDCGCFDLKWSGEDFDEAALPRVCEGVAEGTADGLWRVFDRDAVLAFLAMEVVVNHPDSYTYNLNNYHLYHDPLTDRVSLSPWGADSSFVYYYPPAPTSVCEVWSRYDNLTDGILGHVTTFCRGDPECRAQLAEATRRGADVFEDLQLDVVVEQTRELIAPYVYADPRIEWDPSYFDSKVDCLQQWIPRRPDAVRAWVSGR